MPREINAKTDALFVEGPDDGAVVNAFVKRRLGIDMAKPPYLVRVKLSHAAEACRVARELHGAEYDPRNDPKATLKVRSVWRDARTAGGYGHLVRNLPLLETKASVAFLAWFEQLYLT